VTFVPLSEIRPRDGQAVIYRLRPNGVQVPATYDHAGPAWVLPGGGRQTARGHHQWAPAPDADARPANLAPAAAAPQHQVGPLPLERACYVPACEAPMVARGLCRKHYSSERRRALKGLPPAYPPPTRGPAEPLVGAPKRPPRTTVALSRLDPTTRRLLHAAFERHPDLLEEIVNAQGAA